MVKRKPIDKQFQSKGFKYKQLRRNGDIAIYRQDAVDNNSVSYEVIRVQKHDGFYIKDKWIEPAEHYPRTSSWGKDGFTYLKWGEAVERYEQLVKENNY